ncbi:MAG: hypothetical protein QF464_01720, partial [Myxococcota bacterium]|nr:hypothetical protein [Myxococcota bacterium]
QRERAFETVTAETVDDALRLADVYWDALEQQSELRVNGAIRGLVEAARAPHRVDWTGVCRALAQPVRFNCVWLTDDRLRDVCVMASVPGSGREDRRCAHALPERRAACELVLEGRPGACDEAVGAAKVECERTQSQLGRVEPLCGPSFDASGCLAALTLRALAAGPDACDAVGAQVDSLNAELLRHSCRAIVTRDPGACPGDRHLLRHQALVEVLLRARSGVPWLVVIGVATQSAMCAVQLEWEEGDAVRREIVTLDLTGEGRAYLDDMSVHAGAYEQTRLRLGGRSHPMRSRLRVQVACGLAMVWDTAWAPAEP